MQWEVFLPQGKPHAFISAPHLRALILVQVGEHAGLDCYFIEMAEPATSMNLPTEAVTYIMDDPSHAIRLGGKTVSCRRKKPPGPALPRIWG